MPPRSRLTRLPCSANLSALSRLAASSAVTCWAWVRCCACSIVCHVAFVAWLPVMTAPRQLWRDSSPELSSQFRSTCSRRSSQRRKERPLRPPQRAQQRTATHPLVPRRCAASCPLALVRRLVAWRGANVRWPAWAWLRSEQCCRRSAHRRQHTHRRVPDCNTPRMRTRPDSCQQSAAPNRRRRCSFILLLLHTFHCTHKNSVDF